MVKRQNDECGSFVFCSLMLWRRELWTCQWRWDNWHIWLRKLISLQNRRSGREEKRFGFRILDLDLDLNLDSDSELSAEPLYIRFNFFLPWKCAEPSAFCAEPVNCSHRRGIPFKRSAYIWRTQPTSTPWFFNSASNFENALLSTKLIYFENSTS